MSVENKFEHGLERVVFDSYSAMESSARNYKLKGNFLCVSASIHTDIDWYAEGYISAAELLVKEIAANRMLNSSDVLIFPVLFLQIHALEIRLKQYLNRLVRHKSSGSCNCVPVPVGNVNTLLKQHPLDPIYQEILRLVDHDNLHGNREFKKIGSLIADIDKFGLSTESLRYDLDQSGAPYQFLQSQKWVLPVEALFAFSEACDFIARSLQSDDFDYCEARDFKQSSVDEIKYAKSILEELLAGALRDYFEFLKNDDDGVDSGSLSDFLNEDVQERLAQYYGFQDKARDYFLSYDKKKLALAWKALRFGKGYPSSVPRLAFILEHYSHEDNIRHFLEDFSVASRALNAIDQHLKYLEGKIKLKRQCD